MKVTIEIKSNDLDSYLVLESIADCNDQEVYVYVKDSSGHEKVALISIELLKHALRKLSTK